MLVYITLLAKQEKFRQNTS